MHRLRPVLASLVTTVVVLGLAAPAMAVSWGTIVVYESGVEQGRAYGTFASQSYTYAAMDAYFKDSRPGGNGVFVDIDYMYWVQDCAQCPAAYSRKGNDQTGRTTRGPGPAPAIRRSSSGQAATPPGVRSRCVRTRPGRRTLAASPMPCRPSPTEVQPSLGPRSC